MPLTTWDGHARVAYAADDRRLEVTLATIERTVEADLRRGLRAAFVAGPDGPPASIHAQLRLGSLPADLRDLLGPPLAETAQNVIAGPDRVRWVRLDLAELDDLAAAWAPYRAVVLAGASEPEPARPTLGTVAGRLWTWLGVDELRAALAALGPPQPAVRGPSTDPADVETITGTWQLPEELAAAAGVAATLRWTARSGRVTVVVSTAVPTPDPAVSLWICFDDGAGSWRRLAPGRPGELSARLVSSDAAQLPAVRVRTEEERTP